MIPRLLDVAAFRETAGLNETDFSNYAAMGLLPRALGVYRGSPLWSVENVGDFVRVTLQREPVTVDDVPVAMMAVSVSPAPAAVAVEPVDDRPAFYRAEYLNQLQAAEYMSVSPGWVGQRATEGLLPSTKQFGVMVYKREDLDALMTLPVYTLRKRKGFAHGKPKKETTAQAAQRKRDEAHASRQVVTEGSAVLSRKAAADFLGIHPEELAIMEKDKLGPAYSGLGYRVSDLEAFKAQHLKKDTRGETWTAEDVMKFLNVSHNTLRTWGNNGKGPAFVMGVLNDRRRRLYDSNVVKAFALEHEKDLEYIHKLAGHASAQHLGDKAAAARANRKRVAKKQAQAMNTPKPKARKAGAKVKATKSSAKSAKPSPYVRTGGRGNVARSASARA